MGKGGVFERECGRMLTEWLTRDLEGESRRNPPELWRTKLSGGWEHKEIPDVLDLAPNGELGREFRRRFAVECKHHKEVSWWAVFTQSVPDLIDWWVTSVAECEPYPDLVPMLMIRQNWRPVLVGLPEGFLSIPGARSITVGPPAGVQFYQWDDFYEVPVETVYGIWEERATDS